MGSKTEVQMSHAIPTDNLLFNCIKLLKIICLLYVYLMLNGLKNLKFIVRSEPHSDVLYRAIWG